MTVAGSYMAAQLHNKTTILPPNCLPCCRIIVHVSGYKMHMNPKSRNLLFLKCDPLYQNETLLCKTPNRHMGEIPERVTFCNFETFQYPKDQMGITSHRTVQFQNFNHHYKWENTLIIYQELNFDYVHRRVSF